MYYIYIYICMFIFLLVYIYIYYIHTLGIMLSKTSALMLRGWIRLKVLARFGRVGSCHSHLKKLKPSNACIDRIRSQIPDAKRDVRIMMLLLASPFKAQRWIG